MYYFNPRGISTNPETNEWKIEQEKEIFLKYRQKYEEQQKEQQEGIVL